MTTSRMSESSRDIVPSSELSTPTRKSSISSTPRMSESSREQSPYCVPSSELCTPTRKASISSTPIGPKHVLASITPSRRKRNIAFDTPDASLHLQAPAVIVTPSTPLKRSIAKLDSETPCSSKRIKSTATHGLPIPTFNRLYGAPSPFLNKHNQAVDVVQQCTSSGLSLTESDIDSYFEQWCTNQLKASNPNFQDIAWLVLQKLHQVFPGLELDYNVFFTGTMLQMMRPEGPFGDPRIRAAIDAAKEKADRERAQEIEAQIDNESEQAVTLVSKNTRDRGEENVYRKFMAWQVEPESSTPVPPSIRSHTESPPAATSPTGSEESSPPDAFPLLFRSSPVLEVDNSVDETLLQVPGLPKTSSGSASSSGPRSSSSKYSGDSLVPRNVGLSLGSTKVKTPKRFSKSPDSRIEATGTPSNLRADVSFTTGTPSCMSKAQRDGTSNYTSKSSNSRRPETLRFTAETKKMYASRR